MLVIAAGLNMKLEMDMDMEPKTRTDAARLVFGFGSLRFGFLPFGFRSFAYRHLAGMSAIAMLHLRALIYCDVMVLYDAICTVLLHPQVGIPRYPTFCLPPPSHSPSHCPLFQNFPPPFYQASPALAPI